MVESVLATVRPRVVGSDGAARPLEEVVESLLARGTKGVYVIVGAAGSGKSTALRHLSAVLNLQSNRRTRCRILDSEEWPPEDTGRGSDVPDLTIAAAVSSTVEWRWTLPLPSWGRDEIVEYLLARHPAQCASVMPRISDGVLLAGLPLLWAFVLDRLDDAQPSYVKSCGAILTDRVVD